MPRLQDLSEIERQGVLNFPFMDHDDAPRATLERPLSQAKLALITTAGMHLRGDTPFFHGDQTYRVIPRDTDPKEIVQSHVSIGFDRTPMYRDINVSFPIDRLRELVERGVVCSLNERFYSFMGAQRNPERIVNETGPEVAHQLKADAVDVALLTPT